MRYTRIFSGAYMLQHHGAEGGSNIGGGSHYQRRSEYQNSAAAYHEVHPMRRAPTSSQPQTRAYPLVNCKCMCCFFPSRFLQLYAFSLQFSFIRSVRSFLPLVHVTALYANSNYCISLALAYASCTCLFYPVLAASDGLIPPMHILRLYLFSFVPVPPRRPAPP
jgi:hypothetical protein